MECFRISKTLRSRREVHKKLRKQYVCCIHNVHDVLAHASWKGLTFYKCKRQLPSTEEYYNRIPSRSASPWILQSVSPPGLRCFQQQNHRRRLLNICVLYLLTIDSDAALVSSTFEITHSSISESRWLLPLWPSRELRFLCCCTHSSSSE
jgi:hypothetical protein